MLSTSVCDTAGGRVTEEAARRERTERERKKKMECRGGWRSNLNFRRARSPGPARLNASGRLELKRGHFLRSGVRAQISTKHRPESLPTRGAIETALQGTRRIHPPERQKKKKKCLQVSATRKLRLLHHAFTYHSAARHTHSRAPSLEYWCALMRLRRVIY